MAGTPRNRAIRFAEDELGIHRIFEQTMETQELLRREYSQRHNLEVEMRSVEDHIDEAVMDLREHLREKLGEVSATAFESKAKDEIARNEALSNLRGQLTKLKNEHSLVEFDVRNHELNHRTCIARMGQLGDYLRYLASAKDAVTAAKMSVTDWPY